MGHNFNTDPSSSTINIFISKKKLGKNTQPFFHMPKLQRSVVQNSRVPVWNTL